MSGSFFCIVLREHDGEELLQVIYFAATLFELFSRVCQHFHWFVIYCKDGRTMSTKWTFVR